MRVVESSVKVLLAGMLGSNWDSSGFAIGGMLVVVAVLVAAAVLVLLVIGVVVVVVLVSAGLFA